MAIKLTDQKARHQILTDLDRNLLVQAGAGAGKTHALIGRMVEVIRTGREDVQHIAAITFTKKAAGEMRARFHEALRETWTAASDDVERTYLSEAIDRIDQCYIGTIHAFCARLLRDRPLEVGLPPNFTELDERGERVSLREAWNAFVLDRYADRDPRLDTFDSWGFRTEELFDFFRRRSQFTDVALAWTDVPPTPLSEPADRAREWIEATSAWIPNPTVERPDRLQKALIRANTFLRNRGLESERNQRYLLSLLDLRSGAVTLKRWAPHQAKAREIRDTELPKLLAGTIRPALTQWRKSIYPTIAAFVDEAINAHRARRFEAGTLTFQDLLVQTARLLAEQPLLRRDFQHRYRRLFVDEFQDTDPLQAEILLYLTADNPEISDWRECRPRPGSLFLVGDEKQAIYRFRRADLDVFRDVRERIRESGGHTLDLNTSFRSFGGLCDWINGAFEPVFERFDPRYQASFSPLAAYREPGPHPSQVVSLTIDKIAGNDRTLIAKEDAGRIARFIGASIAQDESVSAFALTEASPGDFMILTRTTGQLNTYARALEHLGIPFSIAGSGKLRESEDLHDLIELLEAVNTPHNPIPLVGHLRGRWVGLGDDELYAVRSYDGHFDYRGEVPTGLPSETAARIGNAFGRLKRVERWLQTHPPSVAIELILEDLDILAFATVMPMGSSRAGNLFRLLALLRRWETSGWNWIECLRELQDLRDDPEYKLEEMTLESGADTAVRLMNLHQAKGLQARVVFLADPSDSSYEKHDPDFHISRKGSEARLTLPVYRTRRMYGKELVSEPDGWEENAEEEIRFLNAEERRLVYVAATRAEDLLVVSRYVGNTDTGPWPELYPSLEIVTELPEGVCEPPKRTITKTPNFDAVAAVLTGRWQQARKRSFSTSTVTSEEGQRLRLLDAGESTGRGTEFGQLVHELFELAIHDRLPPNVDAYLSERIRREEQDPDNLRFAADCLKRLQQSDLLKIIRASETVHTEVDFASAESLMGQPSVTRGRIDLVFKVTGGWQIVDFKTDRATTPTEVERLRSRYGDQVRAYRQYWESLTSTEVRTAGLWTADPGIWIEID